MKSEFLIACGSKYACDDCPINRLVGYPAKTDACSVAQLLMDLHGIEGIGEMYASNPDEALSTARHMSTDAENFTPAVAQAVEDAVGRIVTGKCYEELEPIN